MDTTAPPPMSAPRFELAWHAPAACPDGRDVRATIDRYVGGPARAGAGAAESGERVVIDVDLAPLAPAGREAATADRWQGRVVVRSDAAAGVAGERVIAGPTCDQVAEATALIIAVMLDPLMAAAHARAVEGEAARARAGVSEGAPVRSGEPPIELELGIETLGDLGSLPAPTAGVSGVAGARLGRVHVEGGATAWFSRRALGGPAPGSGGDLGLATGSLRACYDGVQSDRGEFRFGPCLRVELGVASGRGFGLDQPALADSFWGAAFAGVTGRLASSPLTAWLSLDLGSPFARPVYVIDGFGAVFRPSPVLLRASTGFAFSFP